MKDLLENFSSLSEQESPTDEDYVMDFKNLNTSILNTESIINEQIELDSQEDEVEQQNIEGRTDIGPTIKRQLVNSRRGQGIFKANVRLNERCCRLTGETDPTLLIASHIKPWADSSDQEKLDGCNGLLLSPHVDRLFDKGLISFQNDGDIIVSKKLGSETLSRWGLNKIVNVGSFSSNQIRYLQYHRENVFLS